jgi:hypothetical protein
MNAPVIEHPPSISIYAFAWQNGASEQAELINERVGGVLQCFDKSIALNNQHQKALDALERVYKETLVENWDGYGARPTTVENYRRARYFLMLLPNDLPSPDVSAHPDGEFAFEWRVSGKKILTVGIGRASKITYAGIFGTTERYGVENFIDEIPSEIMGMFWKLFTE